MFSRVRGLGSWRLWSDGYMYYFFARWCVGIFRDSCGWGWAVGGGRWVGIDGQGICRIG